MHPIIKNILAAIAGLVVGNIVNMLFITAGPYIIPPPTDADITTMEGLKATMHLFEPKHFIFPFLAHALGTLAGAFLAATIAASHKIKFAIGIGLIFLAAGIANVFLLPSPTWFTVLDLTLAYLPMGYLGGKLATRKKVVE